MRVAILHNAVAADATAADRDVLVQAEVVGQALADLGHTAETVPCTLDLQCARRRLLELRPDVVFNLVESLGGSDALMFLAPALLDALGLPYTGAPTAGMFLAIDKLRAKQRLRELGLPTPDWRTAGGLSPSPSPPPAVFPSSWIIKTIAEHASFGLDEDSVRQFDNERSLMRCLGDTAQQLGRPCFAELFIEGREFNLSVLAGEMLPPAEIDFSAFPTGKTRVVGQRAKWEEGSFEFQATPRRFDFPPADAPLLKHLRQIAADCWRHFGLRGYARVDFRVDTAGRPWVLEINPDPCLSPDAGFYAAARQAGLDYPQLVARILADAQT